METQFLEIDMHSSVVLGDVKSGLKDALGALDIGLRRGTYHASGRLLRVQSPEGVTEDAVRGAIAELGLGDKLEYTEGSLRDTELAA